MDTQEKLTAVIGSLVDTLHEGMERTDGNIPPAMLTALSTSIGSLAQAKANLVAIDIHREAQASVDQSAKRSLFPRQRDRSGPVTLEGEATESEPPPFPERG